MGVDRRSELQAALQAKRDEISSSKARTEAAQSQLATVRGERDRLDAQITASYEELALRIDGSLHEELESWRQRFAGARHALHRAEHDRDELLRRAQLKGEGDAKLLARAGSPPRAPMTEEERALVQKRIAKGKDTLEKRMTVGGLAPEVTKAELRAHFAAYGAVTEVHIETDYVTKASKGHGHVTYAAGVSIDAVQAASHELRGQRLELGRPTFREKPPDRDHIVDGMLWENVGRIHRFSAKARTTVPATYVKVKAGDHVGKVGRLDREKKSKVAVTLFPEGQLEVAADAVAVKRKLRMSDSAVAEAQYEKWAREHGVGEKYKEAHAAKQKAAAEAKRKAEAEAKKKASAKSRADAPEGLPHGWVRTDDKKYSGPGGATARTAADAWWYYKLAEQERARKRGLEKLHAQYAPPTGRRPASAPGAAAGAATQHKRKKPTSERAEEVVVTCPKGAAAGSEIDVRLADGCVITVEVPAGIRPGQKFTICVLPDAETEARVAAEDAERKAAAAEARAKAEARAREIAKKEKAQADAKKRAADDAKQKKAATLLQARHRGTAARRRGAKLAAAKQGEAERKAAPSVDLTAV